MLQIISGKFYGDNERNITPCKGILYSNFAWSSGIATKLVKIEPVEVYGPVSSYVISYNNELEKETDFNGFALVKIGDREIIHHFKLLTSFGLQAYFDCEKETVQTLCRKEKMSNRDDILPSTFTRRFLENRIYGTQDDVNLYVNFIEKAIGLNRDTYKKVISCISAFDTALSVVEQDLNLAYSIMIYSIETLSQSFDQYQARWEDYDQNLRSKLEKSFCELAQEKSTEIKEILTSNTHLKLTKRFIEFTKNYISDDCYCSEAKDIHMAIKKSDIDQLLINAYNTRSGYVHNLRPLIKQLSVSEIAKGDFLTWDNQPYFTFAGLTRLTHHVIFNFIMKQPFVEKENYAWRDDLPGSISLPLAPQYWIWNHNGLREEHATSRFEALLSQLTSEPYVVTDISDLLKKYEVIIPQVKSKFKIQMLCTYLLYNELINEEARITGHEVFIEKHEDLFDLCCIETMVAFVLLGIKWPWEINECEQCIKAYLKNRYKKAGLKVPPKVEVALFLSLGNSHLESGCLDKHQEWLSGALYDSPGQIEVQHKITSAIENKCNIDVNDLLFRVEMKEELAAE